MMEKIRPALYLIVIGMATVLHEPWMIALQAAAGGFALGSWMTRQWPRDATIR